MTDLLTQQRTLVGELAEWGSSLELTDVPARVVRLACGQVLSQLAAIRAGQAHPLGRRLIRAFGAPLQPDPARSASVLAGLGSWLNLDDTAYAGHLSNSTVAVPLAYAHALGLDGRALLTAVIAANECAARVTASATLGPFRGQTAAHTSLVGAVCGRLRAAGAPAALWIDALGLALLMPPWTLLHGYLGSDGRALGAYAPVRMAMDACDAAAAGFRGAADIIEHPRGFLAAFATVPLPEAVTAGLGERWHTDTLSFKVRPGGPGIDAAVDCALDIRTEVGTAEIVDVLVEASRYTTHVDDVTREYLCGPDTPVSALPLSIAYTVATALLSGGLTVADFAPPASREPARWALAGRVRLVHDREMTRKLLTSDAPFGEAIRQAGDRAAEWVRRAGGDVPIVPGRPRTTFEHARKDTPARVTVRLSDGRVISRERDVPVGGAGDGADRVRLMREKFVRAGGTADVASGFARLDRASAGALADLVTNALRVE